MAEQGIPIYTGIFIKDQKRRFGAIIDATLRQDGLKDCLMVSTRVRMQKKAAREVQEMFFSLQE